MNIEARKAAQDARAREMVSHAADIAADPLSTEADRRDSVRIAYEIGLSQGRVDGGMEMSEKLLQSLDKRETA
ncbi:MAG TPA: hypothetical protein VNH83_16640 [Bryobacteraceae bacterium]|nr:hypothetical protein [Bryobacteraceae bacterium]